MTRTAKILCIVGLLGLSALAWESAAFSTRPTNPIRVTVAPYTLHEVCLTLTPQETLHYSFVGSSQSYFNIHYHDADDEAFYPVPEEQANRKTARFTPEQAAYYCLTWTNPNAEGLELSLSYRTD